MYGNSGYGKSLYGSIGGSSQKILTDSASGSDDLVLNSVERVLLDAAIGAEQPFLIDKDILFSEVCAGIDVMGFDKEFDMTDAATGAETTSEVSLTAADAGIGAEEFLPIGNILDDHAHLQDVLLINRDSLHIDAANGTDSFKINKNLVFSEAASGSDVFGVSLPLSLAQIKDRSRVNTRWLIAIDLKNSGGTLYISDHVITFRGIVYDNYLHEISGLTSEVRRLDADFFNAAISITFKNDRYKTYNHLVEMGDVYPFEGSAITISKLWLDDDNNAVDSEVCYKGVLDEPQNIDQLYFTCNISTLAYAMDRRWKQTKITTAEYPNAYEDVGKVEPMIYGANVLSPTLWTDSAPRTTLQTALTKTATSVILSDASRFAASGYIWIDDEKIYYASRSGNTLNSCSRGQGGTTADTHGAGSETMQDKTTYEALIAGHVIHSIGDIYAELDGRLLRVTSGVSLVHRNNKAYLQASSRIKVTLGDTTVNDGIVVSDNIVAADNISYSTSATTRTMYPNGYAQGGTVNNPTYAYNGNDYDSADIYDYGWLQLNFPTTNLGTIVRQFIYLTVQGGEVDIGGGWTPVLLSPWGNKRTYRLEKTGGSWSDYLLISHKNTFSGWHNVYEVRKEVEYTPLLTKSGSAYDTGNAYRSGAVTADGTAYTRNIQRFHVVVNGIKDIGTGAIIERPDLIRKDFLMSFCSFTASDIDDPSFSAAGAWFAAAISGGYKQAFRIDSEIAPSELIKKLSQETRSITYLHKGKWYCSVIPDSAPAEVRTITAAELAGQFSKFKFNRSSWNDIANNLTGKYKRAYTQIDVQTDYLGTISATNAPSQTKHGERIATIPFDTIRDSATAQHVLNHILLQRKDTLLKCTGAIFWEHFDLKPGDTIKISNTLYNDRKFFIEEIREDGKNKGEIKGIEWWQ